MNRIDSAARLRPTAWGISVRSAVVSALIVFVALLAGGVVLVSVLWASLASGVDDVASGRVRDIVSALDYDSAAELDGSLLMTDQRVFAIQVIGADGTVLRRSESAPGRPLLASDQVTGAMHAGIPDDLSPHNDMRMAAWTADTATGRYTVIVGAGSEAAEHTAVVVAGLLTVGAPIVAGVAAVVSYLLVKRSLRSVEAIRARVAEISASDLAERVPVPPQRDEISALAATMNEMLARVESGHAAQRRFVGDASHELRSPLASITSALEVAQDYPDLLDEELRNGTLIPEAHRMTTLVEDLLLLARADEQELIVRNDLVDLDVLAEGEATRLRRDTGLAIGFDAEPARVVGDPTGLGRVLRNLLDNAVRHAATTHEIKVRPGDEFVQMTVSDDGPGIPSEDRRRVFDRFVRLDSARSRDGGGSGLGLAIVAEIVAAHRGSIVIGDRPGGGALFVVTVPVRPVGGQTG